MEKVLYDWIMDYKNPQRVLNVAYWYYDQEQYAAAHSYFLRLLNLTANDDNYNKEKYESLCMISNIFNIYGDRLRSVIQYANWAISIYPNRSEAYYILAEGFKKNCYKYNQQEAYDWNWIYVNIKQAITYYDINKVNKNIISDISYLYDIYIESMLKTNKHQEMIKFIENNDFFNSKNNIFRRDLIFCVNEYSKYNYIDIFEKNKLKLPNCILSNYIKKYDYSRLRYKFNDSEKIDRNYSQNFQDMFVLSVTNGMQNGSYLEIGASHPIYHNNTYLLETQFNWKGISVEFNSQLADQHTIRKNKCICEDAFNLDYTTILKDNGILPWENGFYDYLQLDIEPADNTLNIGKKIIDLGLKFKCITFEHDRTVNENWIVEESREYFTSHGYILVVKDICAIYDDPYEDWYVHKDFVDQLSKQLFDPNVNNKLNSGYCKDIFCKQDDEI